MVKFNKPEDYYVASIEDDGVKVEFNPDGSVIGCDQGCVTFESHKDHLARLALPMSPFMRMAQERRLRAKLLH